jgi:hypothetical protein
MCVVLQVLRQVLQVLGRMCVVLQVLSRSAVLQVLSRSVVLQVLSRSVVLQVLLQVLGLGLGLQVLGLGLVLQVLGLGLGRGLPRSCSPIHKTLFLPPEPQNKYILYAPDQCKAWKLMTL